MRELSFKGFLAQYVRELSLSKTTGLYKTTREAAAANPRLREPLFLYALFWDKEDVLTRAAKNAALGNEYRQMLARYDKSTMLSALQNDAPDLPDGYKKVYRSYLSVREGFQNDNHTKALMHKRIRRLQEKKNVTDYRLYTDLGFNQGNWGAFLKNGDVSKVSLPAARKAIEYLGRL